MAREEKGKKQEPATPQSEQKPAETDPEKAKKQAELQSALKEIEGAMYALKFYPVAVKEEAKDEAVKKLADIYQKGNDTVRQMLLYMLHEVLSSSMDLKTMHTLDYFKAKYPTQDPSSLRVHVYRAMFNYNTSLEGLIEVIMFLGRLRGSDDAVKLLTYHFSHLCSVENESSHMLRSAILDALGDSESRYALDALLDYAKYTDSERTFNRIVESLVKWEEKIATLKVPETEKQEIRSRLKEIITSDFGGSHYG
ncbi:MAG TPA: hypothetical protein VLD37_06970 [Candidatus Bilamarchaeum sp.]|nr:hypothetical protein [Candidatus Bilamarchaeum sp.]